MTLVTSTALTLRLTPPADPPTVPAVADERLTFADRLGRCGPKALSVAYGVLGDASAAADAVQEAALTCWRVKSSLRDPDAFEPWFLTAVRRRAIAMKRRRRETPADPASLVTRQASPASTAAGLDVADALAKLPEADRVAVVMRYYAGSDSREIAGVLGTTPGAVDARLTRARQTLRQWLWPWGEGTRRRKETT